MLRKVLDTVRDVLAILALPVMTLFAVLIVGILWLGHWLPGTQSLRLNYLGAALMGALVIIAFGYLRIWHYAPKTLKGSFAGAEAEVDMGGDDRVRPQP